MTIFMQRLDASLGSGLPRPFCHSVVPRESGASGNGRAEMTIFNPDVYWIVRVQAGR
jgi:hypothetical protein